MKVYKIELDVNNFQQFVVESDEVGIYERKLNFIASTPMSETWNPPVIRVHNPKLEKGDFFRLAVGTFVLNQKASEKLLTECEMSGEILPIKCNNELFYAINVLECVNCLDHPKCEFELDDEFTNENGEPIIDEIESYAFIESMLPETSIFKIPEDICSIYTYTGRKNSCDEFKYIVESNNLKGLIFELVWDSEK